MSEAIVAIILVYQSLYRLRRACLGRNNSTYTTLKLRPISAYEILISTKVPSIIVAPLPLLMRKRLIF